MVDTIALTAFGYNSLQLLYDPSSGDSPSGQLHAATGIAIDSTNPSNLIFAGQIATTSLNGSNQISVNGYSGTDLNADTARGLSISFNDDGDANTPNLSLEFVVQAHNGDSLLLERVVGADAQGLGGTLTGEYYVYYRNIPALDDGDGDGFSDATWSEADRDAPDGLTSMQEPFGDRIDAAALADAMPDQVQQNQLQLAALTTGIAPNTDQDGNTIYSADTSFGEYFYTGEPVSIFNEGGGVYRFEQEDPSFPGFPAVVYGRVVAHTEDGLLFYTGADRTAPPSEDALQPAAGISDREPDARFQFFVVSFDPGFSGISSNAPVTFTEAGPDAGGNPAPLGLETAPVCFAEGTLIAAPHAARRIETLGPGELVMTARGAIRAVKWIGSMVSRPSRHPRPHEVNPVRVRAGAFGDGLPVRDLRLSPGHAVYVDGVLIPVSHLVNGATIVQEEVDEICYYHVELDSHDVLLAEGLPCESYLDDGNRASFVNAGEHVELFGRLDPKSWDEACAPMVAAGPQLVEVQQRLHARAEELGWVKHEDADLALAADGAEIAPMHRSGNRFWFAVPAATSLQLRSNSGVLAHVMPGLGDRRRLGVAVSEVRIDGITLDLEAATFGKGFYAPERREAHSWRWTDGAAELASPLAGPAMVEIELAMNAPSWKRPTPELRLAAAS